MRDKSEVEGPDEYATASDSLTSPDSTLSGFSSLSGLGTMGSSNMPMGDYGGSPMDHQDFVRSQEAMRNVEGGHFPTMAALDGSHNLHPADGDTQSALELENQKLRERNKFLEQKDNERELQFVLKEEELESSNIALNDLRNQFSMFKKENDELLKELDELARAGALGDLKLRLIRRDVTNTNGKLVRFVVGCIYPHCNRVCRSMAAFSQHVRDHGHGRDVWMCCPFGCFPNEEFVLPRLEAHRFPLHLLLTYHFASCHKKAQEFIDNYTIRYHTPDSTVPPTNGSLALHESQVAACRALTALVYGGANFGHLIPFLTSSENTSEAVSALIGGVASVAE